MTDRRSFLRTIATAGGATAGMVFLLPSPVASGRVEGESRGSAAVELPWDEPITVEAATPVARHYFHPDADGYHRGAPINVVFPLANADADLSDVMGVLDAAGWIRAPEEYVRFAWDRVAGEYVAQHATAAETYYGTSRRMHVRCWEFEGVVSMQAHEDTPARPLHAVASYERARSAIESIYASHDWTVSSTMLDLSNGGELDHDGTASVIVPGGDSD